MLASRRRVQINEFVHSAPAPCSTTGHAIRRCAANELSGAAAGLTLQINVEICFRDFLTVAARGTIAVWDGCPTTNNT